MNYRPDWASDKPLPVYSPRPSLSDFDHKITIAAAVLLLGTLAWAFLDAWPSATKRFIWGAIIFLIPSRLIYVMEQVLIKYNKLPRDGTQFKPEDFGSYKTKVEALQRIFRLEEDSRFTSTIRRVRTFSGIDSVLGHGRGDRPSGLGNWDNSCYQNSVIQGLASLPSFHALLANTIGLLDEKEDAQTHLALNHIIERLNSPGINVGHLWTPAVLKSMDSWQQQDAQEYFSKIMDELDKESSRVYKSHKSKPGFEVLAASTIHPDFESSQLRNTFEGLLAQRVACKQCGYTEGFSLLPFNCLTVNMGQQLEYDVEDLLDDHTALENIEGVECTKCTLILVQSQLELFLSRLAKNTDAASSTEPASTLNVTAEARLQRIRKVFEDDTFGESGLLKKCNVAAKSQVSTVKTKQVAIARPPQTLVIHINRSIFDDFGNQRKNTASVRFPRLLDLSQWCLGTKSLDAGADESELWPTSSTESIVPSSGKELLGRPKVYELRCVVTHYGRHEDGHYVAYGKRQSASTEKASESEKTEEPPERWYCFNDEVVTPVSEQAVLDRGNVFMLFYEAVTPPIDYQSNEEACEQTQVDEVLEPKTDDVQELPVAPQMVEADSQINILEEANQDDCAIVQVTEHNSNSLELPEKSNESETKDTLEPLRQREPKSSPSRILSATSSSSEPSEFTPVMRTSSASFTASRDGQRTNKFELPSASVISAM